MLPRREPWHERFRVEAFHSFVEHRSLIISPKGQTISVSQRTPSSPPDVSVSVVTCNNAGQLPGFLDSLRRQERVSWEAFFFDNASQDATRSSSAPPGSAS